jgi:hypothetical protein
MAMAKFLKKAVADAAMDELARAQFLEGVAGLPFGKVSGRGTDRAAVSNLLTVISGDPTFDPSSAEWSREWIKPNRMYNRVMDTLSAVLSRSGMSADEVMQKSTLVGLAKRTGNYFYQAGKRFSPESLVSGDKQVQDATKLVTMFAVNGAKNLVKSVGRRKRYEDEAAERGGIGVVTPKNWDNIIEFVYSNPNDEFSKEFFSWLKDTMQSNPEMTPYEKSVLGPYLDMVIAGRTPSDADYAKSIGMKSPPQFSRIKKNFRDYSYDVFRLAPPDFLSEADNSIFLMNVALGKTAKKKTAASSTPTRYITPQ